MYTRQLMAGLENIPNLNLLTDSTEPKKYDIVHYPFFDFFQPTLPILQFKGKQIVTIHDVIPLQFPEHYPIGKKGTLALAHQKMSLATVSAIITDSQASKEFIAKHLGIPEKKIFVTLLAGNPEITKVSQNKIDAVKEKYHITKEYILYVGDINYNKNIPQLIKTMKYLPNDIQLVCAGRNFYPHDIPEWQAIETQVAMSDVAERVQYITDFGEQPTDTLSALYSGATCYLQPSLAEGFGLPVLEAMQAKTPVVTTKLTSLEEVAGEYAVFASEATAEAFAESITTVLDWSQNKRATHVRNAFAWSQTFSWQKTAEATYQVYKSVLAL